MTIAAAITSFLADKQIEGLSAETTYKVEVLLQKQLLACLKRTDFTTSSIWIPQGSANSARH
jgi:hypothetical protein